MIPRKDPWPEFLDKYLYSLLRNLVSYHGSVSARRYLRMERLLRVFVAGRAQQLRRAVLEDVLAHWERTIDAGTTLEHAFREALAEVADGDTSRLDDLLDAQDRPDKSGERPSYRPPAALDAEPASPVPQSGVRHRISKRHAG